MAGSSTLPAPQQSKTKIKIKIKVTQEEKDRVPFEYKEDEEETTLKKKKKDIPFNIPKQRKKERVNQEGAVPIDQEEEIEKLQQELKAAHPQKKRKLMRGLIPVKDHMEDLFD